MMSNYMDDVDVEMIKETFDQIGKDSGLRVIYQRVEEMLASNIKVHGSVISVKALLQKLNIDIEMALNEMFCRAEQVNGEVDFHLFLDESHDYIIHLMNHCISYLKLNRKYTSDSLDA